MQSDKSDYVLILVRLLKCNVVRRIVLCGLPCLPLRAKQGVKAYKMRVFVGLAFVVLAVYPFA